MRPRTLTLELHGDVSLNAFADAITHFRNLVEALTRDAAKGADIRWVVDELYAGSATATVRAEGDVEAAAPVEVAYIDVGKAMTNGGVTNYPRAVRTELLALVGMIEREFEYLRFETPDDDATITVGRTVTEQLDAPPLGKAYGGIQGRVQTLTNRRQLRFTVYDSLYDRAVACYLREGQEDLMRDAWGRVAVVEGLVTRDPITGRPLNIRDVERVTLIHEAAPEGYLRARGAAQAGEGEPAPEELIRRIRDAA